MRTWSFAALLVLLTAPSAWAQDCSLALHGTVLDDEVASGLPGADVAIGEHHATSAEDGSFFLEGLCPGETTITATHSAFHTSEVALTLPADPLVIHLSPHADFEFTVTEQGPLGLQETRTATTVTAEELDQHRGPDLATSLEHIPGVTVLSGASSASKPMIRGQFGRRLLLLVDRVRHEGQKWGIDHAPEVDPFAANEITVVRGAAGVRYGPDAVGGVILMDSAPLKTQPGVDGEVHLVGGSNGQRGTLAARIDAVAAAAPRFAVRLEANGTRGAARHTPDYVLGNSGSAGYNLGATAGWAGTTSHFTVSWHEYELKNGVCFCVKSDTPGDFASGLDAPTPVGSDAWTTDYHIAQPFQAVQHDTVVARAGGDIHGGHLDATASFQNNHRVEEDVVRGGFVGPQFDFTLRTSTLDVAVSHAPQSLGVDLTLEGTVGVTGTLQENVFRGLPLVPNHRTLSGGVYAWERLWRSHSALEVGARYDHMSRDAYLTPEAFARHTQRGTLSPEDCASTGSAARCHSDWDAVTVTTGGLAGTADGRFDVKLDLSSASRFPSIDEQYLAGTAPTFPVFGLGDPSVGVETTYGASTSAHLHTGWLHAELSPYATYVRNSLQLTPDVTDTGEPAFEVLVRGAFPRFSTQVSDATWYGVDGALDLFSQTPVTVGLQASVVRGQQVDGTPLPFVPAPRAGATVTWTLPNFGAVENPHLTADVSAVSQQTHTHPADFAPAPAGYVLLGASAGTDLHVGDQVARISLSATNVLNTRYRELTSLLRYYADEPGRDLVLRTSVHFQI